MKKKVSPFYFNNSIASFLKDVCTKFVSICQSGSTEEVKHVRNLQTDGRTDGPTTGDQKGSLEPSVSVSFKIHMYIY